MYRRTAAGADLYNVASTSLPGRSRRCPASGCLCLIARGARAPDGRSRRRSARPPVRCPGRSPSRRQLRRRDRHAGRDRHRGATGTALATSVDEVSRCHRRDVGWRSAGRLRRAHRSGSRPHLESDRHDLARLPRSHPDGRRHDRHVPGAGAATSSLGLTLLGVDFTDVKPVVWGDSNQLVRGHECARAGDAVDLARREPAQGSVSSPPIASGNQFVVTDIPIDPLVEGGALVLPDGRLVGIIVSQGRGLQKGDLGLAATSQAAKAFVDEYQAKQAAEAAEAAGASTRLWVAPRDPRRRHRDLLRSRLVLPALVQADGGSRRGQGAPGGGLRTASRHRRDGS